MNPSRSRAGSAVRDFLAGAALMGRGLRLWSTTPRMMFLGVIPALIVGIVYVAGIVVLAVNLAAIAAWATPFAGEWDDPFRSLVRITAALSIAAFAVLLVIATYAALTLAVGEPFYERIWRHVEEQLGGVEGEIETPFWRSVRRGVGDAVRVLALASSIGLAVLLVGFVPVVGPVVAAVLGSIAGGWILALELTRLPFDARGVSAAERRRVLKGTRAKALGFGVTTYLLFLVPLGAVLVMPAAVAGATMLGRNAMEAAASDLGRSRSDRSHAVKRAT
ncbi:MAG: rane protein [Cryobacterium sp.]|nr:rane protein [Cryobacterium sp.]